MCEDDQLSWQTFPYITEKVGFLDGAMSCIFVCPYMSRLTTIQWVAALQHRVVNKLPICTLSAIVWIRHWNMTILCHRDIFQVIINICYYMSLRSSNEALDSNPAAQNNSPAYRHHPWPTFFACNVDLGGLVMSD